MSIEVGKDYIFVDATPRLQSLALGAGNAARAEATTADQIPVSRLTYTAACHEITTEYYRAHHQVCQPRRIGYHD